ncbi:MAG TPA: ESPR domain-containing protein, partial [Salinisphaeraceae bacterium]|nr:ESPR domain-containing protein [Salinisphaeraceae bacterium]
MNRIYSLVWNRNRNQLQVASELARAHGGSSAAGSGRRGNRTRTALTLAVLAALGLVAAPPGWTAECDVTLDSNQSGADGTPGVAGDTAYAAPFGDTVCVDAGVDATGGAGGE